ncbi:helix-turn-helix transcriptional regulator [Streptomyces sp. NPDC048717]|uniref:helix-turn-helix domain-containing protein n=1 Tax=Streptomyces sp. NPDC048717 TaxID=3154928 RepID=UPI00342779B8
MPISKKPALPPLNQLSVPGSSPTVLRMAIAARIRMLRALSDVSATAAAERIRCSASKISRLECAEVPLKERDVLDLLDLVGAHPDERDAAPELVRQSNQSGWWERYEDGVVPGWFDKLIGLQEGASVIRTYEMQLVPGLLQTPAYAFAVTQKGFPLLDRLGIEARVDMRMKRQEILGREDGPQLWALIDGRVLDRKFGSSQVMYEQISHLIDLHDHPRVTLQIVPEDCVVVGTSVTLIRFRLDLPDIAYLENSLGANYLDRPKETEHFRAVLEPASTNACTPAETRKLLIAAAKRYR